MNLAKRIKSIISLITASTILFSFTGCEFGKATQESQTNPQTSTSAVINVDTEVNDINDVFVELNIQPIVVSPANILEINVEDIVVNPVNVKEVQNIEVEVIPINDEFVTVAHENFVSYYGEDIDLKKLFKDVVIGTAAVLVMVTLTTVSGGTATFFGAVLVSEMSKAAVIIGAAIDAAVSGYQAYQEGGDASYIIGHMINGVAEGFKWAALLAPISGAPAGIKAIKAVKYLQKIPGFEKLEDKAARALIKNLAELIKEAPENITDKALEKLYKSFSKEVTKEISEDLFKQIIKNEDAIVDIVRRTDALGVGKSVQNVIQERFWKRAGVTNEVGKNIIKEIKKQSLKNIDDISDEAVRKYINENMHDFVKYFGESFSKDFVDSCLEKQIGKDALDIIKESASDDKVYLKLIEKIGDEQANTILNNSSNLILIQKRFGVDNLSKLRNGRAIFIQLSNVPDKTQNIDAGIVKKVMEDLFDGKIKKVADISNKNIADNLIASRDLLAITFKDMGLARKSSGLFDDLALKGLEYAKIDSNIAKALISDDVTKQMIIDEFGEKAYKSLLNDPSFTIQSLAIKADINKTLIDEITTDALKAKKLSDDVIERLIKGESLILSNKEINDVGNILADYYRYTNSTIYSNFNRQLAEARGENISSFMEIFKQEGNKIINDRYIGCMMSPATDKASYVKAKYGDIYMSKSGFPIFDDYAIARVKISNLTGFNSDITKANQLHHGSNYSIKGYTWHHLEDGETLILIPSELHDAYKHTGGADLLREGLKEAI